PDGHVVAAAGGDGVIRLIDAASGKVVNEFAPAPLSVQAPAAAATADGAHQPTETAAPETLPNGAKLTGLLVQPTAIPLQNKFDSAQLVVTGRLDTGDALDLTRAAEFRLSADVAEVSRTGTVRPKTDGQATLTVSLAGRSVNVPVSVTGVKADYHVDYVGDVMPVLSRLGCNAGTCHGSAQ